MESVKLKTVELRQQQRIVRALVEADLGTRAVRIEDAYYELLGFGLDERAVRSGLGDTLSYYPSPDGIALPRAEEILD